MMRRGFTIVELLIVIVVIGILAAITIVSYNGIQGRAKDVALRAELRNAVGRVLTQSAAGQTLPTNAELSTTNTQMNVQNLGDGNFCVTGIASGTTTLSINGSNQLSDGPCDGHSGGAEYCPNNSHVAINGYYCEGSVNGLAPRHGENTKLLATASGVPANAPGYYVGRQTNRDNTNTTFNVTAGEVYCVSGWATTATSTVNHTIGLHFWNNSNGHWWLGGGSTTAANAMNTWRKLEGCVTVPSGATFGHLWTQNDAAGNSTEAARPWYQTAIRLWKQ